MKSTLGVASSWISMLGLMLFPWPQEAAGGHRISCPCDSRIQAKTNGDPEIAVATFAAVETVVAIPTGRATLVLNCPAQACVSIDGRETRSVGATRQYHLRFDGDFHHCCVKVWVPKTDKRSACEYVETLTIRNHQTIAWSISCQPIEKRAAERSPGLPPPSPASAGSSDAPAKPTAPEPEPLPPKTDGPRLQNPEASEAKP